MQPTATSRPLVLVESNRPGAREAMVASLEDAGFDVATCAGPHALHAGGCPLLETTDCPIAERASAVIHDLDLDDPDDREVLLTLRARYPRLPVVVETSTATARRHADTLADCVVVPPYSPTRLTEVVRGAIVGAP